MPCDAVAVSFATLKPGTDEMLKDSQFQRAIVEFIEKEIMPVAGAPQFYWNGLTILLNGGTASLKIGADGVTAIGIQEQVTVDKVAAFLNTLHGIYLQEKTRRSVAKVASIVQSRRTPQGVLAMRVRI